MFGPIKTVIFDFDGTLVDSMSSVVNGLAEAIEYASGRAVPKDELIKSFGPPPRGIVEKWLSPDKVELGYQHWLEFERALKPSDFPPFKGVEDMLATLKTKKIPIAIYTGRDREGTLRIAKAHNWIGKYFVPEVMACGDDGIGVKPSAAPILHLQKKMGFELASTLMVGDHFMDIKAGRAAGVKTAAVLWDLPAGHKTRRSQFREAWQKWDEQDCDLRLDAPESLTRIFK